MGGRNYENCHYGQLQKCFGPSPSCQYKKTVVPKGRRIVKNNLKLKNIFLIYNLYKNLIESEIFYPKQFFIDQCFSFLSLTFSSPYERHPSVTPLQNSGSTTCIYDNDLLV